MQAMGKKWVFVFESLRWVTLRSRSLVKMIFETDSMICVMELLCLNAALARNLLGFVQVW